MPHRCPIGLVLKPTIICELGIKRQQIDIDFLISTFITAVSFAALARFSTFLRLSSLLLCVCLSASRFVRPSVALSIHPCHISQSSGNSRFYALCFMLYALCFMLYALCFMLYAFGDRSRIVESLSLLVSNLLLLLLLLLLLGYCTY